MQVFTHIIKLHWIFKSIVYVCKKISRFVLFFSESSFLPFAALWRCTGIERCPSALPLSSAGIPPTFSLAIPWLFRWEFWRRGSHFPRTAQKSSSRLFWSFFQFFDFPSWVSSSKCEVDGVQLSIMRENRHKGLIDVTFAQNWPVCATKYRNN